MDIGKLRSSERPALASRPLTPAPAAPLGSGALGQDRYVGARRATARFARLSPLEKAGLGLKLAAAKLPETLSAMWAHKGLVAQNVVAPYLHPLRTLAGANEALAAARQQGVVEAGLALIKLHGSLVSAWVLPLALALAPVSGGAALAVGAAMTLGTAALAATAASFVKNTFDAAMADSEAELQAQSEEIFSDGVSLATAAATSNAHELVQGVAGVFDPTPEVKIRVVAPEQVDAERRDAP